MALWPIGCTEKRPTKTDMYTLAHINTHCKNWEIYTLATRAVRISYNEHLEDELGHLSKSLQNNGYNKKYIGRAFIREKDRINNKNNRRDTGNNVRDEGTTKFLLPYIQGTTNKIAKVLRKKQISTIFCPPTSLRNILDKAKDPVDSKLRKGIYSIPC